MPQQPEAEDGQELLQQWRQCRHKGSLHFYSDAKFRSAYTREELPKKAPQVFRMALPRVRRLLEGGCDTSCSILSLGCGPGTDLLGVTDAFQYVARHSGSRVQQLQAVGVDKFPWSWGEFENRRRRSISRGPIRSIVADMQVMPMQQFVRQTDQKFHLIVMSFVDSHRKQQFIVQEVAPLLLPGGRIFVIDNNLQGVRALADFGFEITAPAEDQDTAPVLMLELQSHLQPQEMVLRLQQMMLKLQLQLLRVLMQQQLQEQQGLMLRQQQLQQQQQPWQSLQQQHQHQHQHKHQHQHQQVQHQHQHH